MKTSHQLARELLALPDIPVYHFDPSRAGMDDEDDTSLSDPVLERVTLDAEEIASGKERAEELGRELLADFITINGEGDVSGEPGDFAEKTIDVLLESRVITRAQVEAAHSHLLEKEGGVRMSAKWGIEEMSGRIYVGPLRADGEKLESIAFMVDIFGHTETSQNDHRAECEMIVRAVNRLSAHNARRAKK